MFFHIFPFFPLGLELQSADRDPPGPGEQQEHACAESEPQQHRLHPQPAVHQPDRPAVSGPERQQAGQPATADETPGPPADSHTEQQPADACPAAVRRRDFVSSVLPLSVSHTFTQTTRHSNVSCKV